MLFKVNDIFKNARKVVTVDLHQIVIEIRMDMELSFCVGNLALEFSILFGVSFIAEFWIIHVVNLLILVIHLNITLHLLLVEYRYFCCDVVNTAVFELCKFCQCSENCAKSITVRILSFESEIKVGRKMPEPIDDQVAVLLYELIRELFD